MEISPKYEPPIDYCFKYNSYCILRKQDIHRAQEYHRRLLLMNHSNQKMDRWIYQVPSKSGRK